MRETLKSLFFFFLSVLLLAIGGNATKKERWAEIKVSPELLSQADRTLQYQSRTWLRCATLAAITNWTTTVFCQDDDLNQCAITDLQVLNIHTENSTEAKVCYTNQFAECEFEGNMYKHGEIAVANCTRMKCVEETMEPVFESPQDCSGDFQPVPGVGCIQVILDKLNYEAATNKCTEIGGQLLVPEFYDALRDQIPCLYLGKTAIYKACFQDYEEDRQFDGDLYEQTETMTADYCVQKCGQKGYDYVGLQYRSC